MAHDLAQTSSGTAAFVYADHTLPWHRLGISVTGAQTADRMLALAEADYDVAVMPVIALDPATGEPARNPDGTYVVVEDSRATVRIDPGGAMTGLATVGTRYEVRNNRETLERALAVVGASRGEAVVDTLGVLGRGERFFATIDLGTLVIDPQGVNDRIARYLVVSCGHDGIWPVRYANTDIRAVCKNTVVMGLKSAQRVFTARHTKNVDSTLEDARTVLRISVDWAAGFKDMAEQLLAVPVPQSSARLDRVLDAVFPAKAGETDRQAKNRSDVNEIVRALYANDRNAAGFGFNGWSAYNAVVEYLDHYRKADPNERAVATMDDNSWVTRKKVVAQQAVLALV